MASLKKSFGEEKLVQHAGSGSDDDDESAALHPRLTGSTYVGARAYGGLSGLHANPYEVPYDPVELAHSEVGSSPQVGSPSTVPAIYKTKGGSATAHICLSGVTSVGALLETLAQEGRRLARDPLLSVETMRVHFTSEANVGGRPHKLSRKTRWDEVRGATALIVTRNK